MIPDDPSARRDILAIAAELERAWSRETSADPAGWCPENPAHGQCAVTAAVVHDLLGGRVVWGEAVLPDGVRVSHYWNEIGGTEIDFTRRQFPAGTLLPIGGRRKAEMEDAYAYVLSSAGTRARYEILKAALCASGALD